MAIGDIEFIIKNPLLKEAPSSDGFLDAFYQGFMLAITPFYTNIFRK